MPPPDADVDAIGRFAATFDAYTHWGSFEACAEIANSRRQGTLTKLRTCLFFEFRRWRHYGVDHDADAVRFIRRLVEQIRLRVRLASDLLA